MVLRFFNNNFKAFLLCKKWCSFLTDLLRGDGAVLPVGLEEAGCVVPHVGRGQAGEEGTRHPAAG